MDNKPITATLIVDVEHEKVLHILPGDLQQDPDREQNPYYRHINWATQSLIPLTQDHIQELFALYQAHSLKEYLEAKKAGLISSNPPDSKL